MSAQDLAPECSLQRKSQEWEPKYPPTDEGMNRWSSHIVEQSSARRRNELPVHATKLKNVPQEHYVKSKKPVTGGHIWFYLYEVLRIGKRQQASL